MWWRAMARGAHASRTAMRLLAGYGTNRAAVGTRLPLLSGQRRRTAVAAVLTTAVRMLESLNLRFQLAS
jgi:hypothetical protein